MSDFVVKKIGVIGAGTMGSGIALTALFAGYEVVLQDPFPQALDKASAYLDRFLGKKGLLERKSAVQLTGNLSDFSDCDVVIEAALEDLSLKHEIFAELEQICSTDAVLVSNTSTLSITQIASRLKTPQRVAGMHFFNPAPVLPLVEIVRGANTVQPVIDLLVQLATDLGKTPVVAEDTPGFIVNRVARPFYGEALRLLGEKTAGHPEIDLAVRLGAGFKMGPFQLMDLIGVDVNATAMRSMFEQTFGEDRYRPHPIQIRQMNSGNLGRKTRRGFYDYTGEQTGIRSDEPLSHSGGDGEILFYDGRWNKGIDTRLKDVGYRVEAYPDDLADVRAVFVTQSYSHELRYELEKLDWLLSSDVPVFIQCHDATLDEFLPSGSFHSRFIGVDTLFFSQSQLSTLVACEGLKQKVRASAEHFIRSLGLLPMWVKDSPGMILPRIVCMLINEAAFAVQEGVADGKTIDLAMTLGVNYPKGLLTWGEELGWDRVLAVVEHLQREYGEDRYRPCRLIRVWARKESRTDHNQVGV